MLRDMQYPEDTVEAVSVYSVLKIFLKLLFIEAPLLDRFL